jgi:CheY-like chemotaxis protein
MTEDSSTGPASPSPAERAPLEERGATDPSRRKPSVLVVDDDALVGRALLRSLRHDAVVALDHATGALARVAAGERFDLLLCDLMMPDMSGMELYDRLLGVAPHQARRMVCMTGGLCTPAAREFFARESVRCIQKPVDLKELRDLIARAATR